MTPTTVLPTVTPLVRPYAPDDRLDVERARDWPPP
jgi:hypothetical protein